MYIPKQKQIQFINSYTPNQACTQGSAPPFDNVKFIINLLSKGVEV